MSYAQAINAALDAHRYALGHDGILSDGEIAWLECTCGWKENLELPEDDIRIAESVWNGHLSSVLLSTVLGEDTSEGFQP